MRLYEAPPPGATPAAEYKSDGKTQRRKSSAQPPALQHQSVGTRRIELFRLLAASEGIDGSHAIEYLAACGVDVVRGGRELFFNPGRHQWADPSMVSLIRNRYGVPEAAQVTRLDPFEPELSLAAPRIVGNMLDGAVQLSPVNPPNIPPGLRPETAPAWLTTPEPGTAMGLTVTVEEALAAQEWFGLPFWASLGANRLDKIALPEGITHLLIAVSNDAAEWRWAGKAVLHYRTLGLDAQRVRPKCLEGFRGCFDWEACLRRIKSADDDGDES